MEDSKKSSSFLGKLRRKDKDKDRNNNKDCLHPSRSASNLLVSDFIVIRLIFSNILSGIAGIARYVVFA